MPFVSFGGLRWLSGSFSFCELDHEAGFAVPEEPLTHQTIPAPSQEHARMHIYIHTLSYTLIYVLMYLRPRGLRSFARFWFLSVSAYRLMRCGNCHTFDGSPTCQVCRTLRRIRELVEGQLLLIRQEAPVLAILRNCAGALTDLAEEAAPILAQELRESGPEVESKEVGVGEPAAPEGDKKEKDEKPLEVKRGDQGEQRGEAQKEEETQVDHRVQKGRQEKPYRKEEE